MRIFGWLSNTLTAALTRILVDWVEHRWQGIQADFSLIVYHGGGLLCRLLIWVRFRNSVFLGWYRFIIVAIFKHLLFHKFVLPSIISSPCNWLLIWYHIFIHGVFIDKLDFSDSCCRQPGFNDFPSSCELEILFYSGGHYAATRKCHWNRLPFKTQGMSKTRI